MIWLFLVQISCPVAVRSSQLQRRPRRRCRAPPAQGFSSRWAASRASCGRGTTRRASARERRCTWRRSSSTCARRCWSWRATRAATTRSSASRRATSSWRCGTTRSWTRCWAASRSRRAACCPTSRRSCCRRRPKRRETRTPAKRCSLRTSESDSDVFKHFLMWMILIKLQFVFYIWLILCFYMH